MADRRRLAGGAAVTFRYKLLIASAATVMVVVGLVTLTVTRTARDAFERLDRQRSDALVAQFRREFSKRGDEVARRVAAIAESDAAQRLAIELSGTHPDTAQYVNAAEDLASANSLDFLEILSGDGTIVSSAQWPARFGYREDWVARSTGWNGRGAFLQREELPAGPALGLIAVRTTAAADKKIYFVGGERLDQQFLQSLAPPAGMRAILYRNLEPDFSAQFLVSSSGPIAEPQKLEPVIDQVRRQRGERKVTVQWSPAASSAEVIHAIPLTSSRTAGSGKQLLGVLLVASSRREQVELEGFIRRLGFGAGAAGVLFGAILSWWATARITRPVRKLAVGARQVAAGDWNARVEVASQDEIGELASAFNEMTRQLVEQRDRLLQAERVAAWRELARRLAHELKNPLFPLQITVENLQRAREQAPAQFDEVFRESTRTLLGELENLKVIIGRFSDFSKMPPPRLETVDMNEVVHEALKLCEAQLTQPGRPAVKLRIDCAEALPTIQADPEQLRRALRNLVLNALDAMPEGGTLTVRTAPANGTVMLEVADTGEGLTPEERDRLFTPYYTTKRHGTGLGLAIVQSVVSDHHGKITVESEPGRGSAFRIQFPTV
jgi:signal transduction histidine kinase